MNIAKDRKALIRSLVFLGLLLTALGVVHHRKTAGAPQAGPKPGPMLMSLAISMAFRDQGNDPAALEGPEVYPPALDHLDDRACWRYPFTYRVRTPLGGMVLHHGAFWVKDGRVIRQRWDS